MRVKFTYRDGSSGEGILDTIKGGMARILYDNGGARLISLDQVVLDIVERDYEEVTSLLSKYPFEVGDIVHFWLPDRPHLVGTYLSTHSERIGIYVQMEKGEEGIIYPMILRIHKPQNDFEVEPAYPRPTYEETPEQFWDQEKIEDFITLAYKHYQKTAPGWFLVWLDSDLYIRLRENKVSVTAYELATLAGLVEQNDEDSDKWTWRPAPFVVNMVFKMFHTLGRDTTGMSDH